MESLWDEVLAALARDPEISRASFATWLKGTRLLSRDGGRFTVAAQHTFAREKLERSYAAAISRAVSAAAGETSPRVEFVVPGAQRPPPTPDARALPMMHRRPAPPVPEAPVSAPAPLVPAGGVATAAAPHNAPPAAAVNAPLATSLN